MTVGGVGLFEAAGSTATAISTVGRARKQAVAFGHQPRLLPGVVKHHASGHRDDEDDNPGRQRREAFQRRSRA